MKYTLIFLLFLSSSVVSEVVYNNTWDYPLGTLADSAVVGESADGYFVDDIVQAQKVTDTADWGGTSLLVTDTAVGCLLNTKTAYVSISLTVRIDNEENRGAMVIRTDGTTTAAQFPATGYYFQLRTTGVATLFLANGGAPGPVLATLTHNPADFGDYDMTLAADDNRIWVVIDGVTIIEVIDNTYTGGGWGFVNSGGSTFFDDIVIDNFLIASTGGNQQRKPATRFEGLFGLEFPPF